jgi:hypothetical protein
MKFIAWFNGKKTIIGASLLFAAAVIEQVVMGILVGKWQLFASPDWVPATAEVLVWFGMFVTGGGLAHKRIKAKNGAE